MTLTRVAIALSLAVSATAVRADDLPKYRAGLWEFKRTSEYQGKPMTMESQKCTDPSWEKKEMKSCKVSPVSKSGNSYTFTADCKVGGADLHSTTVMVRESDSAYRLTVDSRAGEKKSKEVLVARRIGDCKK